MHLVDRATTPLLPGPAGCSTRLLVDREAGSVHLRVSLVELAPGASVEAPGRDSETALFVVSGTVTTSAGSLPPGGFSYRDVGAGDRLRNDGASAARWVEVTAPQPRERRSDRDAAPRVGRFTAEQLPRPGTDMGLGFGDGSITAGALAMLVDAAFGASQLTLFVVEFAPGGGILEHDHPFEELYVVLEGQVEATAGGATYALAPGDALWTGVGERHSFANRGDVPVRWLEAQAPQPPARHAARFGRSTAEAT